MEVISAVPPTVTITPAQHAGIKAHIKAALLKGRQVTEEAAGELAEAAFAAVILAATAGEGGGGAFHE
jgi:hypothetical protein